MKKLVPAIILAALLPLGGCTVYGLGPAGGGAWANYDYGYDFQQGGYGPGGYCPPGYGDPNAYYGGYAGYGGYAYGGGGNVGAYAGPRGYGVYGGAGPVSGAYYGRY
jgi:hypothetical protein